MSVLDALITHDLTPQIDALPRRLGFQVCAARLVEHYITFHYSAVVYRDRNQAAELRRVLDEARFQIGKNWAKPGKAPIYGDGLMYDLVVLSDGSVVRTRKHRRQLWHCNNKLGNAQSWSVHVMLGPGQDLLSTQKTSLYRVFDALRADSGIPRTNVVAHCEWPLVGGAPITRATYAPLEGQSACPGSTLFPHVAAYRDEPTPMVWAYRVKAHLSDDPENNYAQVRQSREVRPGNEARIDGLSVRLAPLTPVEIGNITDGWGWLTSGIGFVHMSCLERA